MRVVGIIAMSILVVLEAIAIGAASKEKPVNYKGDIINRTIIIILALDTIITRFH